MDNIEDSLTQPYSHIRDKQNRVYYLHIPFNPYEWEYFKQYLDDNDNRDIVLLRDYIRTFIGLMIKNKTLFGIEVIKMGLKEIGVEVK